MGLIIGLLLAFIAGLAMIEMGFTDPEFTIGSRIFMIICGIIMAIKDTFKDVINVETDWLRIAAFRINGTQAEIDASPNSTGLSPNTECRINNSRQFYRSRASYTRSSSPTLQAWAKHPLEETGLRPSYISGNCPIQPSRRAAVIACNCLRM